MVKMNQKRILLREVVLVVRQHLPQHVGEVDQDSLVHDHLNLVSTEEHQVTLWVGGSKALMDIFQHTGEVTGLVCHVKQGRHHIN